VVHKTEDLEERTEPFIRGAGLVEIGDELSDTEPAGFSVAVGARSPQFGLRLR
jgi:hypothetical protein